MALEFAHNIQPWLSGTQLQEIADALDGTPESQDCNVSVPLKLLNQSPSKPSHDAPSWNESHDAIASLIFVDYVDGHDANDGSISAPIKHLHTALNKLRQRLGVKYRDCIKKIVLREGTHYLPHPIHFGSTDSNLMMTNHDNERVVLSGGVPLHCEWQKYKNGTNGLDFYQCKVPVDSGIKDIKGLRVNGRRAIRARYPNGDPEYFPCGFCSNLTASSWLPPNTPPKPAIVIHPDEPGIFSFGLHSESMIDHELGVSSEFHRNFNPLHLCFAVRSDGKSFQKYYLGIGGECDNFSPNAGFWCNGEYKVPSGMKVSPSILPNAPYANTTGAIVQTWRPK